MIQSQAKIPTCIGVDGYGCTIYVTVVSTMMASLVSIKRASYSTLEADTIINLIIFDMVRISLLLSL